MLCNYPYSNPGSKSRQIAAIYLADQLAEAEPGESELDEVDISLAELERLTGVYAAAHADNAVQIKLRENRLYAGPGDGAPVSVLPDRRLQIRGRRQPARYEIGDDGVVTLRVLAPGTEWAYAKVAPPDTTPDVLESYTGAYHSEELGTEYTARVENGKLVLWHYKHGVMPLEAVYADGFAGRGFDLTFTRDSDRRVDGFTASSGRVWKVRFDRVEDGRRAE